MVSVGIGDDIAKLIENSGAKTLYDLTREFFNWGMSGGFLNKEGADCSPCEGRQIFLNKLLPYDKQIRVRFLEDYFLLKEDVVYFSAKKGEEIDVKKGHPIYALLFMLCRVNKIEAV